MKKTLGKRLRFQILKRDRFTCRYCGKKAPEVVLEIDHVVPRCAGGSDAATNLVTACLECNRGKSSERVEKAAFSMDGELLRELSLIPSIRDEVVGFIRARQLVSGSAEEIRVDSLAMADGVAVVYGKEPSFIMSLLSGRDGQRLTQEHSPLLEGWPVA